jgi:hypothetical protein
MLDLEPIKAREQAASPGLAVSGRWYWDTDWLRQGVDYSHDVVLKAAWEGETGNETVCLEMLKVDAEFIACARGDVPALVDEVEALRVFLNLERQENTAWKARYHEWLADRHSLPADLLISHSIRKEQESDG